MAERSRARSQNARARISNPASGAQCRIIYLTILRRFSWPSLAYYTKVAEKPINSFTLVVNNIHFGMNESRGCNEWVCTCPDSNDLYSESGMLFFHNHVLAFIIFVILLVLYTMFYHDYVHTVSHMRACNLAMYS